MACPNRRRGARASARAATASPIALPAASVAREFQARFAAQAVALGRQGDEALRLRREEAVEQGERGRVHGGRLGRVGGLRHAHARDGQRGVLRGGRLATVLAVSRRRRRGSRRRASFAAGRARARPARCPFAVHQRGDRLLVPEVHRPAGLPPAQAPRQVRAAVGARRAERRQLGRGFRRAPGEAARRPPPGWRSGRSASRQPTGGRRPGRARRKGWPQARPRQAHDPGASVTSSRMVVPTAMLGVAAAALLSEMRHFVLDTPSTLLR